MSEQTESSINILNQFSQRFLVNSSKLKIYLAYKIPTVISESFLYKHVFRQGCEFYSFKITFLKNQPAALERIGYTGCIKKKVYSWKILAKLTSE